MKKSLESFKKNFAGFRNPDKKEMTGCSYEVQKIIGDDLFIISFVIKQWTLEINAEKVSQKSKIKIFF